MTNLEEINQLIGHPEGPAFLVLCAELTIYWRGSCFERSTGLISLYKKVVADFGHRFKFYETGTMTGAKPIRADSLDLLPFWLQNSKPRKDIYQLILKAGTKRNEPSSSSMHFIADEEEDEPIGAMKICFPIESLIDNQDGFLQKVIHYIGDLKFESGHAGFGINWDPCEDMDIEASEAMSRIAAKFQGIDLSDLDITLGAVSHTQPAGIKCASWLTIVGDTLVGLLGGTEPLAAQISPPCRLYPMKHGVLLRACEKPLLGNRNRNEDMSAYKQIGRLLARFRYVNHQPIFGGTPAVPAEEATQRWLARFDE